RPKQTVDTSPSHRGHRPCALTRSPASAAPRGVPLPPLWPPGPPQTPLVPPCPDPRLPPRRLVRCHLRRVLRPLRLLQVFPPLADLPVGFALVGANDQDHMGRFLRNLACWGLQPEVVVSDGSSLYPELLATIWPDARHQLCVFHLLRDVLGKVLDAVRRLRQA